jgi:hypothetical protein
MELLDNGFPFLKRSLLGKHQGFIERDAVLARLQAFGHPLPSSAVLHSALNLSVR